MQFAKLIRIAEMIVSATQKELPREIQKVVASVPVCYEKTPCASILEEGMEPDILGLFVGSDHGQELSSDDLMPAQIILYLDNLWDYSESDEVTYRKEIRITYLHEVGHFLGWDEGEVARRGLD